MSGPGPDHLARRDRLRPLLEVLGVEQALITDLVNIRYLSGFSGSNAGLTVSRSTGETCSPRTAATRSRPRRRHLVSSSSSSGRARRRSSPELLPAV